MMLAGRDYGSGLTLTENQLIEGEAMRYKHFLAIFFIVTANPFASENWNEINEIILNEKEHLITLCAPHKKLKFDIYYELRNYLTGVDTVIGSVEKLERIVNSIQGLGADEKNFKIMVQLLNVVKDQDITYNLCLFILQKGRVHFFKKYSSDLRAANKNNNSLENTIYMYLPCELNDDDKNIIRKRIEKYNLKLAIEDSVRLGDTTAEKNLISLYERETDFWKITKIIKKLISARTQKCELALVRSLDTKNQISISRVNDYSIRFFIIQALGQLNHDNDLFNSELGRVASELWVAEKKYHEYYQEIKDKITNDYYKKVYDMVFEKYSIRLEMLKNEVFLYKKKSNIIYNEIPSKSRRGKDN